MMPSAERRAPVQGYEAGIPWPVHLEAWDAYAKRYGSRQSAERMAERGGFHTGELDQFIPGWRERVSYIATLEARIKELEPASLAPVSPQPVADEGDITGEMWLAGRKVFVVEAERFHATDRYEAASAIADRAPEKIYLAMLALAHPDAEAEQRGRLAELIAGLNAAASAMEAEAEVLSAAQRSPSVVETLRRKAAKARALAQPQDGAK